MLFSRCRDGQELEAESSCLFAEAHFGSLVGLFVVKVEDSFCAGFFRRQDMIENSCDFMCGGGDRLGCAELRPSATSM